MRKRYIDPDIWRDPNIGRMSAPERLLFIGIITIADDYGRLVATPASLQGQIYPLDTKVTARHVMEWREAVITKNKNVILYTIEGVEYMALKRWKQHQKVSKPTRSQIPPPPGDIPELPGIPREPEHPGVTLMTEVSAPLLALLRTIAGYPYDAAKDALMLDNLSAQFPKVNLLEMVQSWAVYKLDKPLEQGQNPRSQLRTWLVKSGQFEAEAEAKRKKKNGALVSDKIPTVKEQLAAKGIKRD